MNKPIPYGRQEITPEDIQAVVEVLNSDFLTQGPKIKEFEEAFASYIGSRYAVAVSNGTAALHLSAMAMEVKEGDKVITTPVTFAATANSIRYCGGEVVFADIDPDTFLLSFESVCNLLRKHPKGTFKGIVPVDLGGYPVNLEKFRQVADEYGLWIIEDACHAPGGSFTDSKGIIQNCGNGVYSDATVFSFHPVKHIACGEGGMITTNNKALYEKLLMLRTHGITKERDRMEEYHGGWYYEMQELGYNYRIPDMNAALGLSQLKNAGPGLKKRKKIAQKYHEALSAIPEIKIIIPESSLQHAYHLFIIQTAKRRELYDFLRQHNIFCQVHYIPVHLMPYYKALGHKKGDFPKAEDYYEKCLSLPMYPALKTEEQNFVIEKIREFYE